MPRRKTIDEATLNQDRWLVSYADFVTLLFAFFVVMYSVSQVNESKYKTLSSTLMEAFSETPRSISPIQVGQPTISHEPSVIEPEEKLPNITNNPGADNQKTADLSRLSEEIVEQFTDLIDEEVIQIASNEYWLQISLRDSILFSSGQAELSIQAESIFSEIADLLKGFDNPIQVEGFTDDRPISNTQFASNWELSSARASAVVRILANSGIDPTRLSATGYGEFQPIAENQTPEGRAQNRRVVLMIARERVERPRIKTKGAIEEMNRPLYEESQPYPESSDKVLGTLVEENPDVNIDHTLKPNSDKTEDDDPLKPIKLEGGGLLFTTDPERRN